MKTIGVFQLGQKTYETIAIGGEWGVSIPRIPKNVHITFLGDTGEGKTEAVIQFVKQICLQGISVDWISYEQGHGWDLQMAVNRNQMIEVADCFKISDPHSDKPDDITCFQDLFNKVTARGSADFFVIDSTQFSEMKPEDFKLLLNHKKSKNKGFIWISHKEPNGKLAMGILAQTVARLGQITILVKNYIAEPIKNRFGGNEKYVIYEKRARLKEPKFFEARDKAAAKAKTLFTTEEISADEQ